MGYMLPYDGHINNVNEGAANMDMSNEIWTLQEMTEELRIDNDRADQRQAEQAERLARRIAGLDFWKRAIEAMDHKIDVVKFHEYCKDENYAFLGRLVADAITEYEQECE